MGLKLDRLMVSVTIGLLLAAILIMGGSNKALAQSEKERVAKLIEGAKLEKKIGGYGSMTLPDATVLIKEFEKIYPFLKVEYTFAQATTLLPRIIMEEKAQKHLMDFTILGGEEVYILGKEGILMKYESPEAKIYPKEYKDSNGYWVGSFIKPKVIAYNTKLVSPSEVPSSFEDLLDPKWKGKIGMTDIDYDWFHAAKRFWGKERATSYLKKLAGQNPTIRGGGRTLSVQLLAAGEIPINFWALLNAVILYKRQGATIDWVPGDFVPFDYSGVAVITHATHPNGAKLFADFVLSKRAQEAYCRGVGRVSSRPDIVPDIPNYDKINFVFWDPAEGEIINNETRKEFEGLLKVRK